MKVLSPFGPKIAVVKIPLNLVKKINDEVESIITVSYTHLTLPTRDDV